ncbi:M23 family metallopeptidase [Hydrogenimonas thermophila]|uniref:Peptidase family M23 n=1 Tax=Hydrogenimonas thermophila TaxID=223786 RepID=A0A1I5UEP4_9BACT|nr:M23 family metallopeptidase [Hydrogenimonas thermophila]SFP93733.1 Peptidase family M23 [Hydrogenimonas thermophila]
MKKGLFIKKNRPVFFYFYLFLLITTGLLYIFSSNYFERESPVVTIENNNFWNLKKPIEFTISDNSGIKEYKIILETENFKKEIVHEKLFERKKSLKVVVKSPHILRSKIYKLNNKYINLIVKIRDISKWKIYGNQTVKTFTLKVDTKKPYINIIEHSYKISRGGSALVIFQASDENFQSIYIQINNGKKFKVEHFIDNYYISLIAWPISEKYFKATIVAKDKAGNISKVYIPLYLNNKFYKTSNINLSDKFLQNKIPKIANKLEKTDKCTNTINCFKYINEELRHINEKLIQNTASFKSYKFNFKPLNPLKNAAVLASFGGHRKFFYKGKLISESYHLGLDLASYAMSKIYLTNNGKVVFAKDNGIYGNTLIIAHGLGLYSLYAHCSSFNVSLYDKLYPRIIHL